MRKSKLIPQNGRMYRHIMGQHNKTKNMSNTDATKDRGEFRLAKGKQCVGVVARDAIAVLSFTYMHIRTLSRY